MIEKLKGIEERYVKLEHLLSDPAVIKDQIKYQKYVKEHGELNRIVPVFRTYEEVQAQLEEARELLKDPDPDMRGMAR
ncbi:MAG TPA: PCRF domain-containing protein, partial [Desulfotignum sp.]|nr:PCRF domain-containing protein [Desulfotignum sp.]